MTNRRPLFAILVSLLVASTAALAWAQTASGATIDKTGWWNQLNTTVASPAGPVTLPPPPGVDEGELVVGAASGEPVALSAIGIRPEATEVASVKRFELKITESPDPQNATATGAAIQACPTTDFWAGGPNGDWETRPLFDCAAAKAAGVRGEDGTWTFDLRPIGEAWFDPFGTIRADGIVLVESAEPPVGFQVVFTEASIEIVLEVEAAADEEEILDGPVFEDPPADAGFAPPPGQSGSTSGRSPSLFTVPQVTAPPAPRPVTTTTTATVAPAVGGEVAAPTPIATQPPRIVGAQIGNTTGNLPVAGIVVFLAALAVVGATAYWFGPAGQPTTVVRARGVSRALEQRAAANREAAGP